MIVYRVENGWGEGPYNAKGARREGNDYRSRSRNVFGVDLYDTERWPTHELWRELPKDALYGFAERTHVNSWFRASWRRALARAGFKVAVFEAETVWPSRRQVAFIPARRVWWEEL